MYSIVYYITYMTYANAHNGAVAAKVRKINQAHISTEKAINDDVHHNDPVTSQVDRRSLEL